MLSVLTSSLRPPLSSREERGSSHNLHLSLGNWKLMPRGQRAALQGGEHKHRHETVIRIEGFWVNFRERGWNWGTCRWNLKLWVELSGSMGWIKLPPKVMWWKESACNAGDLGSIPGLGRFPLEKGMAIHFSILAWRIPMDRGAGGLQSMESQRVRRNWVTNTFTKVVWSPNHQ